jgi:hypothetical protein
LQLGAAVVHAAGTGFDEFDGDVPAAGGAESKRLTPLIRDRQVGFGLPPGRDAQIERDASRDRAGRIGRAERRCMIWCVRRVSMPEAPLTRRERLRRTAQLCGHCIRNLAYYRAGRNGGDLRFERRSRIHGAMNGNFLDIMVLEWLKLFVASEQHAWQNIVTDRAQFSTGLLAHLNCTDEQFTDFINEMRTYRDKFVAHLDSRRQMDIPVLDKAKDSAIYYHRYLLMHENEESPYRSDLDYDIGALYADCEAEAIEFYEDCSSR